MFVFDSYVNMFHVPSANSTNSGHQDQNPRFNNNAGTSLSHAVSHTAYQLASQIDDLFLSKRNK